MPLKKETKPTPLDDRRFLLYVQIYSTSAGVSIYLHCELVGLLAGKPLMGYFKPKLISQLLQSRALVRIYFTSTNNVSFFFHFKFFYKTQKRFIRKYG